MMHYLKTFFVATIFLMACHSTPKQANTVNDYADAIKTQGENMAQLLVKKDYVAFTKFTYPKIVELMGGEQKMIEALQKSLGGMEASGVSFLHVGVGEPSKVITVGNELQCTVPQTIELKTPQGRMVTVSTLVALSTDGGNNWYFIDSSGKDIQTMRQSLPNLSPELVIAPKQEPKVYNN